MSSAQRRLYLGIDVGTGSARAGLFDGEGKMHAAAAQAIALFRPAPDICEQSSEDIWRAVARATRQALRDAGADAQEVAGIGCDATCSLVALAADDRPVSVSPTGDDAQNVIVWIDHRALDQAARINATAHPLLRYVGGTISPEMQTPKLLWLKEHAPATWARSARFFDLPDYLVYRATHTDVRSLCSTVCKWTYLGHEPSDDRRSVGRWDETFFCAVGLGDLSDEGYRRIGTCVRPMGEAVGHGLTAAAAADLGLMPQAPVAVSIIDAHAGGLGLLGAPLAGHAPTAADLEQRLALIGGTSSCHMAVARAPAFVPGVWGPYFSAMVPELWLTEGGQSATGALIDHLIFSHARADALCAQAAAEGTTVYALLNQRLDALAQTAPFPAALTQDLHVLPDFHGNRSPRADASLRGMISGLSLSDSIDDLARLYLATIQAIAHGTRHIVETMNAHGYGIATILACGGGSKNALFLREHADISGCRMVLPREPEAVLLGAALLGAVAAGAFPSVMAAMGAMTHGGSTLAPACGAVAAYHDAKHRVFLRLYEDQQAYRALMRVPPTA